MDALKPPAAPSSPRDRAVSAPGPAPTPAQVSADAPSATPPWGRARGWVAAITATLAPLLATAAPIGAQGGDPARATDDDGGGAGIDRQAIPRADGVLVVFDQFGVDDMVVGWSQWASLPPVGALGGPRDGLSAREVVAFVAGRAVFVRRFGVAEGLGPYYNEAACADCHAHPTLGGVGTRREHVISVMEPADLPGETVGLRRQAIAGRSPEQAPGRRGRRRTPPLFGLGLLDALPEAALVANADPNDADGDGVAGRFNRRGHGREARGARFGAKAHEWDLWRFIGGAMRDEMGITNPAAAGPQRDDDGVADPEVDLATMRRVDAFVRGLAPPPRAPVDAAGRETIAAGERQFDALGCTACHRAVLGSGEDAVRGAYTDLLLHDLGAALDAGLADGSASATQWRTPPLWGLRLRPRLLHDERVTTPLAAIALHGGEAVAAKARFFALAEPDRRAVLAFLASL